MAGANKGSDVQLIYSIGTSLEKGARRRELKIETQRAQGKEKKEGGQEILPA
jgi:hypothetical protein